MGLIRIMALGHLLERSAKSVDLKRTHICSLIQKKNYGLLLSNVTLLVTTILLLMSLMKCRKFYGISDEMDPTLLLTRCKEGKKKNIYFTSPLVRDLTELNADRITVVYFDG